MRNKKSELQETKSELWDKMCNYLYYYVYIFKQAFKVLQTE